MEQGHRQGGAAVVGERAKLRVERVDRRARQVGIDAVGEASAAVGLTDQIVSEGGEGAGEIRTSAW